MAYKKTYVTIHLETSLRGNIGVFEALYNDLIQKADIKVENPKQVGRRAIIHGTIKKAMVETVESFRDIPGVASVIIT